MHSNAGGGRSSLENLGESRYTCTYRAYLISAPGVLAQACVSKMVCGDTRIERENLEIRTSKYYDSGASRLPSLALVHFGVRRSYLKYSPLPCN